MKNMQIWYLTTMHQVAVEKWMDFDNKTNWTICLIVKNCLSEMIFRAQLFRAWRSWWTVWLTHWVGLCCILRFFFLNSYLRNHLANIFPFVQKLHTCSFRKDLVKSNDRTFKLKISSVKLLYIIWSAKKKESFAYASSITNRRSTLFKLICIILNA